MASASESDGGRFAHPRSVYVHVPFCQHRCGYCDFSLVAGRDDLVPKYLAALERELFLVGATAEIDTLYIGGGTPTRLGPVGLRALFRLIHRHFQLASGYEWTVEANPNDINTPLVEFLQQAGVNRVSLGIQSFSPEKLLRLDRRHVLEDNLRALAELANVASLSMDLIFAAPEETLDAWQRDVHEALTHRPQHLSCYGLTFEKGTPFFSLLQGDELVEVDEELQRKMYEFTIIAATAAGYEHYEVSSFALPGHRSRHNQVYWNCQPYFGFGPGAASYVGGCRSLNHRSPLTYMQRLLQDESPVAEQETISHEAHARDRLVFGLRMREGLDERIFAQATGFELLALGGAPLARFLEQGAIERVQGRIRLTHEGLLVSDSLWPELISV